jgi:hypothetical protein
MSADWTALQVNVMPLDSSGAYTPLVSGTVSVKVSPFESDNYWIDVNNNNYYGVALRLKIIKTELPAAVSSLRVSVWRAGVSPQSVVNLQPDVALSDITTQSYIDRVIPKETKSADCIGFNAGYLVDIEKAAKLFNPKFSGVKFELNGNTNAAVCCLSSPSGETAKIVVMPMRID